MEKFIHQFPYLLPVIVLEIIYDPFMISFVRLERHLEHARILEHLILVILRQLIVEEVFILEL